MDRDFSFESIHNELVWSLKAAYQSQRARMWSDGHVMTSHHFKFHEKAPKDVCDNRHVADRG